MFEDITSDGSNHWNPSTGIPPSSSAAIPDTIDIEAITDVDLLEDPQVPPSPASPFVPSTKKRLGKTIDDKHKKPRTAQVMQDEITQIKIIAKESQETVQSFIKNDDATSVASTMNEVLALGILEGSDEHYIATELFIKREQREMFLHMGVAARKDWRRRKFTMTYGK
ncbi:LOW QUALITY PROTEIN: hypothetical protein CFC21_108820 [Triticum aestivum]|uniref:Uncharacterized protein n=2 Tax=Triticum aestivum TaxID=4565 RepID=A0A9R1NC58_WHEAT|nr:LOW QUALITY PROTEIN: hypothetical protein CFC21_108820 [Triticum aestivum]